MSWQGRASLRSFKTHETWEWSVLCSMCIRIQACAFSFSVAVLRQWTA